MDAPCLGGNPVTVLLMPVFGQRRPTMGLHCSIKEKQRTFLLRQSLVLSVGAHRRSVGLRHVCCNFVWLACRWEALHARRTHGCTKFAGRLPPKDNAFTAVACMVCMHGRTDPAGDYAWRWRQCNADTA